MSTETIVVSFAIYSLLTFLVGVLVGDHHATRGGGN
jgi:hypothetical protein